MSENDKDESGIGETAGNGEGPRSEGAGAEGPTGKDKQFDLGAVISTVQRVLTQPEAFYREMPTSGGYTEPLIFVVVMAVVLGLFLTVFSFFGLGSFGAVAVGLGSVIVMPIFAMIGSFVAAAIMFVVWKLMGSSHDYETSYRCVAYASAIYPAVGIVSLIPYLGSVVGIVWGVYLMVVASVEVHKRNRQTAYIVLGVLGAISLLMNISSERQARRMQAQFENLGGTFEGIEDMTPEEAGERLGEFLRGLEEGLEEEGVPQN
jgi:hypothetical protein